LGWTPPGRRASRSAPSTPPSAGGRVLASEFISPLGLVAIGLASAAEAEALASVDGTRCEPDLNRRGDEKAWTISEGRAPHRPTHRGGGRHAGGPPQLLTCRSGRSRKPDWELEMGCLFAMFAGLFPRLALFILWIARPARIDAAFDTFLWPLLGIIFLPFATLMYVLLYTPGRGLIGWDWFWVGIAALLDIGHWAASATQRNQLPGRRTTAA
jgi:hypothetical protein